MRRNEAAEPLQNETVTLVDGVFRHCRCDNQASSVESSLSDNDDTMEIQFRHCSRYVWALDGELSLAYWLSPRLIYIQLPRKDIHSYEPQRRGS